MDLQRVYIQSQMYKPFMREEEALAIYEQACLALGMPYRPDDFPGFLTNINQALDQLNLSIRQEKHHSRDISYCLLINEEADELSKLATTLTPPQIGVFRTLVNKILDSPQGQLTSMDVLNTVPSTLMTKAVFEKTVLHKLVAEGWLEETTRGNYTVGIRTLVELKKFIEEGHPDLDRCLHCENVAIIKIECQTPDCNATYHRRCLEERKNRAGARLPCGKCQQPIMIPADVYSSTTGSSSRSSQTSGTKRARLEKPAGADEEEEEEDELMEEDDDKDEEPVAKQEPLTQRRTSTRAAAAAGTASRQRMSMGMDEDDLEPSQNKNKGKGKRAGGRRKAVVDDDDDDMDLD
ncbi:hypothetical protein BCR44DRAFT_124365 [Catenaria anguillulae PL171]|uniref:Non-structural maintenance of chromosomes element 1 homolog n=1 Tax=Catenaria anguillulae PL171 TaxID=765915 RepID=A0A1Y2I2L5_9FUNG|nr:hypothetical protein BCR44DRAFT_124365 [Catenaria anguillulae PL171]